ncbi:MAG: RidA family protein [Dehalococcoidia bacterium]
MHVEERLQALGLALYDLEERYRVNPSGARFVSHLAVGNLLYLSGTVPIKDDHPYLTGVVGRDLTVEQGYEAARYALLSALAVVKFALSDLDRVEQAVQMTGYVNSAPDFADQPRVVNGATDLLIDLYGDRGMPTRAAIGCQGLALNSSVEIVLTLAFSGESVRPPLIRHRDTEP